MKTIWKFPLSLGNEVQPLDMPAGAQVLTVADQHGLPTVWMEVDDKFPNETRHFRIHGTGHTVEDGGTYIGTGVGQEFVWHVYEYATEHSQTH